MEPTIPLCIRCWKKKPSVATIVPPEGVVMARPGANQPRPPHKGGVGHQRQGHAQGSAPRPAAAPYVMGLTVQGHAAPAQGLRPPCQGRGTRPTASQARAQPRVSPERPRRHVQRLPGAGAAGSGQLDPGCRLGLLGRGLDACSDATWLPARARRESPTRARLVPMRARSAQRRGGWANRPGGDSD